MSRETRWKEVRSGNWSESVSTSSGVNVGINHGRCETFIESKSVSGSRQEGVMTEEEWVRCADPERLLELILPTMKDSRTNRKWRLAGCAFCRWIWPLFTDERTRYAVEVSEEIADGVDVVPSIQGRHWEKANAALMESLDIAETTWAGDVIDAAQCALGGDPVQTAFDVRNALLGVTVDYEGASEIGVDIGVDLNWLRTNAVRGLQHDLFLSYLVRCVYGNPFRPVAVEKSWLAWNGGTVVKLAQAIYEERRFEDMPVLADALEEANCTNEYILSHCRGPGPHARGCFVIDLLLGKT